MARCFVTGAYGFIGRYLVHELVGQGFEVIGGGRDLELARRLLPDIDWVEVDFNKDVRPQVWLPRLKDVDVVINCAGILQSTYHDDAERIHRRATTALFEACAMAGVSRLIHISAMSAEGDVETSYASSKAAADAALGQMKLGGKDGGTHCLDSIEDNAGYDERARALNWLIVKPSIVVGHGCHGGTSMIRALAAMPLVTPLPAGGSQTFQPIAMSDLVRGLANLARHQEPARTVLFATGPETLSLRRLVAIHRRWLGFAPARELAIPRAVLAPVLKLGDALGYIGNGSAMRSTSMTQLDHLGHADPAPFAKAAGIELRTIAAELGAMPATVQDRMHARSVFPLALAHGVIALFWIATGLITLTPAASAHASAILMQGGLGAAMAWLVVTGGAVIDIILGVLFIPQRWLRLAGALQLALSAAYLLGGLVLRPDLWLDPLGPMIKVLPLMAATALVMALNEKR